MRAALEVRYSADLRPGQRRVRVQFAGINADPPGHLLQQAVLTVPGIELVEARVGLGFGAADYRRQPRHDLQVPRVAAQALARCFISR